MLPVSTSARAARKRLTQVWQVDEVVAAYHAGAQRLTLPFDVLQALIESQHSDRAMAIFTETGRVNPDEIKSMPKVDENAAKILIVFLDAMVKPSNLRLI